MKVRSILRNEIHEFCKLGQSEEEAKIFEERLLKAWEEKRSYPEWCFVLEDNGKFIARVGYDIFPSDPLNLIVWRLYVPEGDNYVELGTKLFKGSVESLKGNGLKSIEHHLYGNEDKIYKDTRDLFLGAGFQIKQQKKNFIFTDGKLNELSGRLRFKSLRDVGEEKYIEAIKMVTEGTLDTYDEKAVQKIGKDKAAYDYFYTLQDIDFNEDWWKLACEMNGDFAGLIIPQKFTDKAGAINYIGVAPEKRGRGYVRDLLIMGTSILKDAGIEEVIADIDINNVPMENALTATGYEFNKNELILEIEL